MDPLSQEAREYATWAHSAAARRDAARARYYAEGARVYADRAREAGWKR